MNNFIEMMRQSQGTTSLTTFRLMLIGVDYVTVFHCCTNFLRKLL